SFASKETPLHLAALVKDGAGVARALLDAGAEPNAKSAFHVTPLMYAAWTGNDIVSTLMKFDADATCIGLHGENALGTAAWNGFATAVDLMLEAGAHPCVTDYWGGHSLAWAAQGERHDVLRAILARHRGEVDCPTGNRGWGSPE